jgi:Mce-associated membrane protein
MIKPRPDDADEQSINAEGKSAAVSMQADAATEHDTAGTKTAQPIDAAPELAREPVEPSKARRRIGRLRTRDRGVKGRRGSETADKRSDQCDEEPIESDAKDRISWSRVLAHGILPGLALLLAAAAGFLKWQDSSVRESQLARSESVAAAKDSTIALLSYKADTVEKDLDAGKSRLTGTFKDSYSQLISDVVIPGAKREHISTTATVPAASSVSATPNHAVTLLFVNQTAVVDKNPPTDTTSSVRVTLDKIGGRWLIAGFDPV